MRTSGIPTTTRPASAHGSSTNTNIRTRKHAYDEVIGWFESNGFEFTFSIPKIESGPFKADERLFEPHIKGTKLDRFFTQLEILLQGESTGAIYHDRPQGA